jgi:predicted methyltransferase
MIMRTIVLLSAALSLAACAESGPAETTAVSGDMTQTTDTQSIAMGVAGDLGALLSAQPEAVQARYDARNPQETLTFFGIEPGMTVVEALPGGGWYSKLLIPYLGDEGALIGANYTVDMQRMFGFYSEERLQELETWTTDWPANASTWVEGSNTPVSGFVFGSVPQGEQNSADAVLFIRALHNLARFENQGKFLTTAIDDAFQVLKPGGVVGVVQHQMREEAPDAWAEGNRGYLKQSFVIDQMERAGFVFESASDINANPLDQPEDGDIVWRLPPTLMGSKDNAEAAAAMLAIGESNRMTLKFRKPAA